jgi:hypothetical protein
MGAIERQVTQVKRKNSTSCSPPEARLIVVGSVACSPGPREVATGNGEGTSAGDPIVACAERLGVGVPAWKVGPGSPAGCEAAGAHAASKTAIQRRVGRKRVFVICLLVNLIFQSFCNIKFLPDY